MRDKKQSNKIVFWFLFDCALSPKSLSFLYGLTKVIIEALSARDKQSVDEMCFFISAKWPLISAHKAIFCSGVGVPTLT